MDELLKTYYDEEFLVSEKTYNMKMKKQLYTYTDEFDSKLNHYVFVTFRGRKSNGDLIYSFVDKSTYGKFSKKKEEKYFDKAAKILDENPYHIRISKRNRHELGKKSNNYDGVVEEIIDCIYEDV